VLNKPIYTERALPFTLIFNQKIGLLSKAVVLLTLELLGANLGLLSGYLDCGFHGFPHSDHANAGTLY
jgi:hypothetical protein